MDIGVWLRFLKLEYICKRAISTSYSVSYAELEVKIDIL